MSLWFAFDVTEHFGGEDAPEAFGTITLRTIPNAGDTIMLKWLDGTDAYQSRVDSIDGSNLHVTALK